MPHGPADGRHATRSPTTRILRVVATLTLMSIVAVGCSSQGREGDKSELVGVGPISEEGNDHLVGVGPISEEGNDHRRNETESGTVEPFVAALEKAFGYSLVDIEWATDRAIADRLADCMVLEGWEFERVVPPRFDATATKRTTAADQALSNLFEWDPVHRIDASSPPEFDQDQYNSDEATCFEAAITEIPSPVSSAWSWLGSQTEGVRAAVASDIRTVEALIEEQRCLNATGYDSATLHEATESFVRDSYDVVAEVREGSKELDDAVGDLDVLAAQEREIWDLTEPCVAERLRIVGIVAGETQAAWLEENGDRLATAVAMLSEDIKELGSQLQAIVTES